MMRLSIGTPTGLWFEHLVQDNLDTGGASQFEKACQSIQNKLFDTTMNALKEQKNDENSFEYDLHEFHRAWEIALIYQNLLPGWLADSHTGCVMLCLSLARLHSPWLTDAFFGLRKRRNPELFQKKTNPPLTMAEEDSKVSRFLEWTIFSAMKNIWEILLAM